MQISDLNISLYINDIFLIKSFDMVFELIIYSKPNISVVYQRKSKVKNK